MQSKSLFPPSPGGFLDRRWIWSRFPSPTSRSPFLIVTCPFLKKTSDNPVFAPSFFWPFHVEKRKTQTPSPSFFSSRVRSEFSQLSPLKRNKDPLQVCSPTPISIRDRTDLLRFEVRSTSLYRKGGLICSAFSPFSPRLLFFSY